MRWLGALAVLLLAGAGQGWAQDAEKSQGQQLFMANGCFACHGQMGDGGAGPRLRGNRFLSLTDYVAAQILLGRGIMPAFGDRLNDEQIAAVATYIRNSWGNNFGEVKPQEVAQTRRMLESEQPQTGSSEPQSPQNPEAKP
jgi:mono/diheme cytochrome c family protein